VLEVRLLGAPEFLYDGRSFRFAALPRALPLLGWCLLHRRTALARDNVAFAFWPDVEEEEARANLRRHLYAIAKALPVRSGEPWIIADKKTVAWNASAPLTFDVAELERFVASEETLDRAAELYRGPFLEGYDEPWIEPERERIAAALESALQRALERDRASAPERAIGYAKRLLVLDPWREDAVRALLELRHRLGDRAGALKEYRSFAERLRAELDVAPMVETTAVYDAIAHADTPLRASSFVPAAIAAADIPATLPARVEALVGRQTVVAETTALLATTRCATLVGTGGVGKTRLAVEVAWAVRERFPDGVAFVNLASLGDSDLVSTAIASALGIAQATQRLEIAAVVAAIGTKRPLLVLDNCEHVIGEVARCIAALLTDCPAVSILATSREPLAVRGERVYRVPSLEVPPALEFTSVERARAYGSVALFEERARGADPGFRLDRSNVAAVVEMCRRLDGIALAIELAAARITVLEPAELARRLDERFRILDGGERTALPRQRTMRASIDWSWELSSEAERTLLERVAVFSGGWTLAAAEAVCFDAPLDIEEPVSLLGALVDRSLVVAAAGSLGRRYRLLESIREYALEKLAASERREAVVRRHAAYYAAFGARIEASYETTPDAEWYALAISELDNVRAALRSSFAEHGDALVGASLAADFAHAWAYGASRGDKAWLDTAYERLDRPAHPLLATRLMWQTAAVSLDAPQHARWVAAAVRNSPDSRMRAEALRWIAEAQIKRESFEQAESALDEAAALDDDARHPKAHAATLRLRAELARVRGDVDAARAAFNRAIAAATASGATSLAARARSGLAELAFAVGDAQAAIANAATAREELLQDFGRTVAVADIAIRLAAYELARRNLDAARTYALEAIAIAIEFEVPARLVAPVEQLAVIAERTGDAPQAARFFGFADGLRRSRSQPRLLREVPGYDEARERAAVTLGDAEFTSLVARGTTSRERQIVEEARCFELSAKVEPSRSSG
jgi:predicted ATPase/DNA-binding SARP family transcriptional activator